MPISGATREVQLVNVLQVHAMRQETLRVTVEGRDGAGVLFMDGAEIVHANYGSRSGQVAVQSMLAEGDLHYLLATRVDVPERTCKLALQQVLFAMGAESLLPEDPELAPEDDGTGELLDTASLDARALRSAASSAAREQHEMVSRVRRPGSRALPLVFGFSVVLLGAVGLLAWQPWRQATNDALTPLEVNDGRATAAAQREDGPAEVLEAWWPTLP